MTVNIQYVGVDVSETLSTFTEEKLEKLLENQSEESDQAAA